MEVRRFPGLIDVHVHLREPGATHKEDFLSGTQAALAGGFTFVLDMPNNPVPTVSLERLEEKIRLAQAKAVCQVGFHYGTDGRNLASFQAAAANPAVYGLKVYGNQTTGDLLIENKQILDDIFSAWNSPKPILVHAEKERLVGMIDLAKQYNRRLHVCHVARAEEVELIRRAKQTSLSISAGVTPHHLYLTETDRERLQGLATMKPTLGSQEDRQALWQGIKDGTIDLVETDHAPHTLEEKRSQQPPFGVPGLETAAVLVYEAVRNHQLTEEQLVELLHHNPKRIFAIPDQPNTYVEMATDRPHVIGAHSFSSKANWSPFASWLVSSRITRVVMSGQTVFSSSPDQTGQ